MVASGCRSESSYKGGYRVYPEAQASSNTNAISLNLNGNESNYGEGWQYWYNNPKDERAIEPPAAPKKQMDLYDQLKAEPDAA
jgi:hypothetical protein